MGDFLLYLTIALSVIIPDGLLLITDKLYEKLKEEEGYKNNYPKKKLFKNDDSFDTFTRVYGLISLFVPGLNMITDYILVYRRVHGITLNQEIRSGAVSLEEQPIVISEEDVEVIDTKDIPDETEDNQRNRANANDEKMADVLEKLMIASLMKEMFGPTANAHPEFYEEPTQPTEEESAYMEFSSFSGFTMEEVLNLVSETSGKKKSL